MTDEPRNAFLCQAGFAGLAAGAFDVLMGAVHLVAVKPRRPLFRRGQSGHGIFVVRSGELRVALFSPDGRQQIVRIATSGKLLVEAFSPEGAPTSLSAFARTHSEAWHVGPTAIETAAAIDPTLWRVLLNHAQRRHQRAIDLVFSVSLLSVEQRLATFILDRLRAGASDEIRRDLDVSTVAALLGTVREEITRAQRRIRDQGAIDVDRDHVRVLNQELLERIALG